MDTKRRLLNHNKRWDIEIDQAAQLTQLKNRVIGVTNQLLGPFLANEEIDQEFSFLIGEEIEIAVYREVQYPSLGYRRTAIELSEPRTVIERAFGSTCAYKAIQKADSLERLVTVLQHLFWLLEKHKHGYLMKFAERIQEAVKLTPGSGFQVVISGKSITLYPLGAKLLDKGTVNDVLAWLENYPKVAKHFEQALKIYMDGDSGKYRNLLDNLRFAIEQLLKEVLGNKKSLENQQKELLNWLNKRGIHQEVVNLYNQLLFGQYCMYQNDAVKHSEAFSKDEIEFMIYLSGTFMRLLLQLV
ncbi:MULTISPECIES: hypothetical protein [Cyanophyceae]|uniref:hypothetical protein n=1 Tax=Cyanophyceae TaxID=3028117 RepID=UPI00168402BC|nr:hypothetical protein [Trichocoleus sp. FACHB-69]MBD1931751.1 hypothetical protein [Trichocoleus sp. FACHB-69]